MKIFRRIHMYLGLALVPFVILYGVTALLFNHPTWLSTASPQTAVDTGDLGGLEFRPAHTLAESVAAAIAARTGTPLEVVDGSAELTSSFVIDVEREGARDRYRIEPDGSAATVQTTTSTSLGAEAPIAHVPKSAVEHDAIRSLAESLEQRSGGGEADVRSAPDIEFIAQADGRDWVISADLFTGKVRGREVGAPTRPLDLRSYLLRLHKTHVYPGEMSARWVYTVIVDVMGATMVLWGLTGLVMWWQMKPLRKNGVLATVGGIALALTLGYAMFRSIFFG
ncbi:MAG: PepSY domain-containing protein [Planctomycetota bacterium]